MIEISMNILVTGAKGFIGKNIVSQLKTQNFSNIYECDVHTDNSLLELYCKECDIVFHLAGINRPNDDSEFMKGNFGYTSLILDMLKNNNNKCPIIFTSSTQANIQNLYGNSKKAGEDLLFKYSEETQAKTIIYRLPNVFGKWCKPNYNSAIATFCYNIANNLPIKINDPSVSINLVYIDDVVKEFISLIGTNKKSGFYDISCTYNENISTIVEQIYLFKQSRESKCVPDLSNQFTKKLYSTYLSYLPEDLFSYRLDMNIDNRGSFTEFIKTKDRGQVSVNISKPNIIKGNHWHNTKTEKFLVVNGKGVIRFRRIDSDNIIEYFVSDENLEVIDIPPGYTHNIENLGSSDMVTLMWANEQFNPDVPDTYFLEV